MKNIIELDDKSDNSDSSKRILTTSDCKVNSNIADYYMQILVFDPDKLKKEYRETKYQLWLAYVNTFGCDPDLRGQRIHAVCLADGEIATMLRSDFLGICMKEKIPKDIYENGILDKYMKNSSIEEDDMEDCL